MAKFSFPQENHEDPEIREEEGTEGSTLDRNDGDRRSARRIFIIAGIGAIVIGGWYLANQLFLTPSPPPPAPARPAIPAPQKPAATAPIPAAPIPTGPAEQRRKEEARSAAPAPPAAAGKAPPVSAQQAAPGKPGATAAGPGKAESSKATTATKAEGKPAPTSPAKFSLQMGAMVLEENAEALKRKLDTSGFPAVIRKGTAFVSKQVVTVGELTGRREAEELSRRLNVDGFPSQLLDVGGKYTPQIGAFFNLDEAIDLARELQKKNYHPKITSKPATTVVYQVRHGMFDSRSAAVKRAEELKSKGFNQVFVVHE